MKNWGQRRRRRAPVLALLCLALGSSMATAQTLPCTKFFEPGLILANFSWHDPDLWNPVGVPGPTDVVCILEGGMYNLNVTLPVTVAGIEINAIIGVPKLKVLGTTFTLNGPGLPAGNTMFKVNDGAVLRTDGGGAIEVHSKLVVDSGTVEIDIDLYGHLNFGGTGLVTGAVTTHPGSVIELAKDATSGDLIIADGFDNNGEINLGDVGFQSLTVTSGTLVNTGKGTIASRPSGGPSTEIPELRADVVNHGVVDVDGLDLRLSHSGSQFENSVDGVLQVTGAELELDLTDSLGASSSFVNYGTTTVAADGSIRVLGSAGVTDVPSNFTNHGTATVAGGGSVRIVGSVGGDAPMNVVNYGTITLAGGGGQDGLFDVSTAVFHPKDGTIDGDGQMILSETAIAGPATMINRVDLTLASCTSAADVSIENQATMTVLGQTSFSGPVSNAAAATTTIEGSDGYGAVDALFEVGLSTDGQVILGNAAGLAEDVQVTVTSESLTIGATGGLQVLAGAGGERRLTGRLFNQGAVTTVDSKLVLNGGGASHQNEGSISTVGGDLEIALDGMIDVPSNFTNHGSVAIGGGTTVVVLGSTGATGDGFDASLINLGTIDIEASGALEFVNASFDNPSGGRVGGFGILDLNAASSVFFDGTVSPGWSPGIFTIGGPIGVGSNTRLEIELGGQSPGVNQDRLDVNGDLGVDGVLDVDLIDPYSPVEGDVFEILTFAQLTGWFSLLDLPVLPNLLAWNPVVGASSLQLEVVCAGTQIGIASVADRDPVSVGYELTYHASVGNPSSTGATQVEIVDPLPPNLSFRPDLSSPECALVGSTVECSRVTLAPQEIWDVVIGADVMVAGQIENTFSVSSWECDTNTSDNAATVTVDAVLADPCDANYDLSIDADDLEPTVGFIFGGAVAGNPDCRLGDGVTADDLAAIVEEAQ